MATTTKKAEAPAVDWSLAPRGVVSATVQGAGALVALGGGGELAHVSPLWAAGGAAVGALSHAVVSANHNYTRIAVLYRAGCWVGAGSWLTWVWTADQPWWNPNGLAALAISAVGAAVLSPMASKRRKPVRLTTMRRDADAVPGVGTEMVLRGGGYLGEQWQARIRRVTRVKVVVTDVRHWDNKAGVDVLCVLPPGPATRKQIAAHAEALAADARLPEGCGVEVKTGAHRGAFIVAVTTVNRLGSAGDPAPVKLHHPDDYSPRSILQPIALGEHRDGSTAEVMLREDSVLIVARKGGGKTSLLEDVTLGVGRCVDALNWHIDLNGGGMSQMWLHPWLEGEAERPPIDWAASTPIEALLMVKVALAIAIDRKTSYRTYKAQQNAKLLPVSAKLPEIVISVDEGAEALAPANRDPILRQVRDGLEQLQRIGRNEAINPVVTALRPTQDMIPPNMLKQSAVKVGMYGIDYADLGHLYGWQQGISVDDLPTKGCAFLGVGSETPRPMKAYLLEPDQIRRAALAIAAYRPELDAAGADVADSEFEIDLGDTKPKTMTGIYAGRYQRMRAAFTGHTPALPTINTRPAEPVADPAVGPTPLRVINGGQGRPGPALRGAAADWPEPTATTKPAAPARRAVDWPEPAGRPVATGVLTAPRQAAPAQPIPEPIQRALQAFEAASDDRMHSETLAAELGLTDKWALSALMRGYGIAPHPGKFKRAGERRRGYWLDDIRTAADRIARGETPTPITTDDLDDGPDDED